MAYDEQLVNRIREELADRLDVEEKKMFQGLCFMVDDKMCICSREQHILCRIGEQQAEIELEKGDCSQAIMRGRVMKDFVYVEMESIIKEKDLRYWVGLCLAFNKEAKASKKKS